MTGHVRHRRRRSSIKMRKNCAFGARGQHWPSHLPAQVAAVGGQGHKQKCALTPNKSGETRWDGKNMQKMNGEYISKDDLEFLLKWSKKR